MKYLKGIINKPPICEQCGKPMTCEVHPPETNFKGTSVVQQIGWVCRTCYDPQDI